MAFRILASDRVKRIIEALAPRFTGRDQDHLLALADEAADAGYSAAYDYTAPLYAFKATIESSAGASDVGITDAGGLYTSTDVEGALQEAAALGPVTSVFGRTGAILAASNDYTFAQIGSKPTTLGGYGITDAAPLSHVGSGGTAHSNVVAAGAAGFMTGTDKTKLDGIAAGAQVNTVSSVFGRTGAVTAATNDYTFAQIGSTPTTLSGYGITDAPTVTGSGALGTWGISITGNAGAASTVTWSGITSKPTTVGGYGITDAITTAGGQTIAGNLTVSNTLTANGFEVGYRSIPLTTKNAAYTMVAGNAGAGIIHTDTTARTYTVPNAVFSSGDVVTVANDNGTAAVTLAQGAGLTMYLTGTATTGSRTLAARGIATLFFTSASTCYVSGAGVT